MVTIKTEEDIEILREGGRRLATILDDASKLITPGISIDKINTFIHEEMKKNGDTPAFLNYKPAGAHRPFPAASCICVNDEIVHGIPNENPAILKEGDLVTLDAGLTHKDLITDHARTFAVGEVSKELSKLMEVTKNALKQGILAAREGNRVGDVSFAIEEYIKTNSDFYIIEGLAGHGVGYSVHEPPYVPNYGDKNTGEKLKKGMVLAIEPMLSLGSPDIVLDEDGYTYKTEDGSISAQFEHTIVVGEERGEILTNVT